MKSRSEMFFSDWPAWWLTVRCRCGACSNLPIKLLIERYGGDVAFDTLPRRLRCQWCRASPPVSICLVDDPAANSHGRDRTARVIKVWPQ